MDKKYFHDINLEASDFHDPLIFESDKHVSSACNEIYAALLLSTWFRLACYQFEVKGKEGTAVNRDRHQRGRCGIHNLRRTSNAACPRPQRERCILRIAMSTTLTAPVVSTLGEVLNRAHRINANSFQQSALITSHGWQYAAFYASRPEEPQRKVLYANISRRRVNHLTGPMCMASAWEGLEFQDYEQVVDDGHNTMSIGVCHGDGTIHLAFDHHCDTSV